MVEAKKQLHFYFFEIVVAIIVGGLLFLEPHDIWLVLLGSGVIIFGSMILNAVVFREDLVIQLVAVFGLISLVTISLGTYFTFGIEFAIVASIIVLILMFIFISMAQSYFE